MNEQSPQPPKLAGRFLKWFCAPEVVESLEGDLYELYLRRVEQSGKRKADLRFYIDVLDVCRPFAWKKNIFPAHNYRDMFKNNLKITFRHLWNNRGISLLNITGLSLGVICCIIIFLTVQYEFSFDKHHQNAEEIYRVTNNYYYPTFTMYVGNTPDPMAEALKNDFSDFKNVFSIYSTFNHNISVGDQIFTSDIIACGPEFIQAFDYYNDPSQWVIGHPLDILKKINTTILTQTMAEKLFKGAEQAIGQIISLSNGTQLEVAGVIQDPPANTNYPFEQLVSELTFDQFANKSFGSVSSTTTFVQLPAAVNMEDLRPALNSFNEKYMEAVWGEDFVSIDLQPLLDIHLDDRFGADNYTTDKSYLWTLSLIGFFMIIIACINFVNLATAKAISRSKEIGMRKILGSSKQHIMAQFMTEALVLATISLCLGLFFSRAFFAYFSEVTQLNIGNDFTFSPDLWLFLAALLVFTMLAMGLYPAIELSGFQPLAVIRQKKAATFIKGINLRRGLIAFQLTASQVLVIAAIVITAQLKFFQSKDLGFDQESILVINLDRNASVENKLTLKNRILQFPFVQQASLSSTIPISGHLSTTGLTSKDSEIKDRFNVEYMYADNDFVEVLNLELLAGKAAITQIDQDTVRAFVVNETLINRLELGSPEAAVGKSITLNRAEGRIIGVVKDFHTLSLHKAIKPVAIGYGTQNYGDLAIKYQTGDINGAISQLEASWEAIFPDRNFDYYFQDESMGHMYENEVRFSKIIKVFTLITILIACFGLFGLSAFSVVRRFREIGVRKVLGATTSNILFLVSREFIGLTLLGFLISIPVAYYLVYAWLEEFAYHVELEWWMILLAGVLTLGITLIAVGFQSIKAALINPIISLRNE